MHKGIPHKTRKNKGRKNKSRKMLKGGMGATEYVAGMFGDLNQQMASASEHMQLTPLSNQSGGKSRRKGLKGKKGRKGKRGGNPDNKSSSLAGGDEEKEDDQEGGSGISHELKPAEYGGQMGNMSDGQKGGYMMQLLERAAVPFGLFALQNYAGKRSKKNRKYKK